MLVELRTACSLQIPRWVKLVLRWSEIHYDGGVWTRDESRADLEALTKVLAEEGCLGGRRKVSWRKSWNIVWEAKSDLGSLKGKSEHFNAFDNSGGVAQLEQLFFKSLGRGEEFELPYGGRNEAARGQYADMSLVARILDPFRITSRIHITYQGLFLSASVMHLMISRYSKAFQMLSIPYPIYSSTFRHHRRCR